MKNSKVTLIITVIICLLPIILGVALYDKLPDPMPIHFGVGDEPDNYGSKNFTLFGIPVIMAVVQFICCFTVDRFSKIKGEKPKIQSVLEWLVPILTVVIYVIMVRAGLGNTSYIGKCVCLMIGILFMVMGNYMPKMSYEMRKSDNASCT